MLKPKTLCGVEISGEELKRVRKARRLTAQQLFARMKYNADGEAITRLGRPVTTAQAVYWWERQPKLRFWASEYLLLCDALKYGIGH